MCSGHQARVLVSLFSPAIFHFPFSIFNFPFSIFNFPFSIFHFPFSILPRYSLGIIPLSFPYHLGMLTLKRFDIDRFLFIRQELPVPAVLFGLCAVTAVVLVSRYHQLPLSRYFRIVLYRKVRILAHILATSQLTFYPRINSLLHVWLIALPQTLACASTPLVLAFRCQ